MTLRAHTNAFESICSATAMECSQIADDCRSMLRTAFRAIVRKPPRAVLLWLRFCYAISGTQLVACIACSVLCCAKSIVFLAIASPPLSEAWSGVYVLIEAVRHLRDGAARTSRAAPTSPR